MSTRRPSSAGPVCGLGLVVLWAAMGLVVLDLPRLDADDVSAFWTSRETETQLVIAAVSLGYPLLVVFLLDWHRRCLAAGVGALVAGATVVLLVMFVTCLNVALGLTSAAGQLVASGERELGYALHTGAFVLAAPAAGLGLGGCVGLALASRAGLLRPRALSVIGALAAAANLGPLGGLFTLSGPFNSGDGLLGGILLPLGTLVGYVLVASVAWLRRSDEERQERSALE